MIKYLKTIELLYLHGRIIEETGGSKGVRDWGLLESAVAQPRSSFGNQDLYPDLVSKAAALGYFLVLNHPFVDGNKRIGHAAIEAFLGLNGFELLPEETDEEMFLRLADGRIGRDGFEADIRRKTKKV